MTVWLSCPGQGVTAWQFPKFRIGGESCKFYLAAINLSDEGCGLAPGVGCGGGKGFDGTCFPSQERSNPVLLKAP